MEITCISKLVKKIQRIIIRYPYVNHTPLTRRTSTPPLPGRLSVIPGTGIHCPDEKLSYMEVAQNGSMDKNTILIPPPHPSNIPNVEPSPLRTVCPMICPV